jgi:uncharacterized protein YcfJ
METRYLFRTLTCAALLTSIAACSAPLTEREKTTLGGAALGAGTGALIGHATGHNAGAGAAIGGGIGALGGALIGDQIQGQRQSDVYRERELQAQEREIRRQRAELEELRRRDRYDDDYYDEY